MKQANIYLESLTTHELERLLEDDRPVVVMIPVGSVEPHGPHLPLSTDTCISTHASMAAASILRRNGLVPLIGPAVPYGVTECARAFRGAISIDSKSLCAFLTGIVRSFLQNGVDHVCLVNNHLEPEHDRAVRNSIESIEKSKASVACPLTRRWARSLSDEFKKGACHAGEYETSIMLASRPDMVDLSISSELAEVPISLSDMLKAGVKDFAEMGLSEAYAGSPATANKIHGVEMLKKLAVMIATEIMQALDMDAADQSDHD